MSYSARMAGRNISVEITGRRPHLAVRIDDVVRTVTEAASSQAQGNAGAFEITVDGTAHRGWRCVLGNDVYVRLGSRTFVVSAVRSNSADDALAGSQLEARADMPGVVIAVHCEAGQAVNPGDKLVTIESMKLQATLVASHEATVERVHVGAEAAFERGAILVSFARPRAPEPASGPET